MQSDVMTDKIPQTKSELETHFSEQLYFLETSAAAFDAGYEGEAKRLAVSLRVLLHNSAASKSLLDQLGKKDVGFYDTGYEFDPNNLLTHNGLIFVRMSSTGAKYLPFLDDTPYGKIRKTSFDKWWNAVVFVDNKRNKISRKDVVLSLADQDGGAHVDPKLNAIYARLSRSNSLNSFFASENSNGLQPLSGPQLACVRQIAHEVLKTLKPETKKKRLRHLKNLQARKP